MDDVSLPSPNPLAPTVYLAGPTVFFPDVHARFSWMKRLCQQRGVMGLAPLDAQIGLDSLLPGKALSEAIVAADIGLMDQADAGIFCLDGFRHAPEMDAGTAFEVGYMHAKGKPLVGWSQDVRLYPERVTDYLLDRFGQRVVPTPQLSQGATSGSARDPDGVLVHSEGCVQNSMVHVAIERSGGAIFLDPDPMVAFANAIAHLAQRLLQTSR